MIAVICPEDNSRDTSPKENYPDMKDLIPSNSLELHKNHRLQDFKKLAFKHID
jgi:hypothetical protein